VLEKFFSRKERAKLFRSWAGAASMWLKAHIVTIWIFIFTSNTASQGGTAVWGNSTHAPDDLPGASHTYGHFFAFRAPSVSHEALPYGASTEDPTKAVPIPARETNPGVGNLTASEAGDWILEHTPSTWQVGTW
jgi:phospholipid:diacylglycerol acyltransferase